MTEEWALVVGPGHVHGPDSDLVGVAAMFDLPVTSIAEYQVVHLRASLDSDQIDELAGTLLADPVIGWTARADDPIVGHDGESIIETGLRPGVTDREGAELVRACAELGLEVQVATIGRRFAVASPAPLTHAEIETLAHRVLHNEVIERWAIGPLAAGFVTDQPERPVTETIQVIGVDRPGLDAISAARRLGMNTAEMVAARDHFAAAGRNPTDAEIETLAQTWSEHCAHKTFRAAISIVDEAGEQVDAVDGLLRSYLRAATDTIDAPWVRSAFVDNAGIVAFDDRFDIALKAETHNHPSALEPFGGANTGVGGVVRDIIGVSAKPIAITDILCFGPPDLDPADLPAGVLHPRRVRDGVIAGVGDYGNKIGVPNVGGAIVYDPAYTTTPLVFAGCVGLLPTGSHRTEPQPGDAIVVLGGAVGRDGVGGATFSSQTMGVETADVAGSSVQIGDPIVEKGLIDAVIQARDLGLYTAITDCGAGGLSSSIGEMAAELGADVDLALVPRKYPGLAAWETWLSEAQERMVLAAPDPEPLIELAAKWGVAADVVGRFTGDGRLVVREGAEVVVDLDCGFLHGGCPRHELVARRPELIPLDRDPELFDRRAAVLDLLAHPTIASKEATVRTYDHEVMGGTLTRPYGGPIGDGAGDGAATIPPGTSGAKAMSIGIGVNALLGDIDAESMAWQVVDEAVRNAVISGADPDRLSLLDNFAWGNPNDPETLGRLVAACQGCHDAALAFGAPFVSGKDSLYNVFVYPDGTSDPVAPTLVITAVGIVEAPDALPLTGLVEPGNQIWMVGPTAGALRGSHLDVVLGTGDRGGSVPAPDPGAVQRHREMAAAIGEGLVASAHDPAEGGLAVAAAEWAHAGRLGMRLDIDDDAETLFGEGSGRYLVEIRPEQAQRFAATVPSARPIGEVLAKPIVKLGSGEGAIELGLAEIGAALIPGLESARELAGGGLIHEPEPPTESGAVAPAATMTGSRPRVLLPVALGTNRDGDLAQAFESVGAVAERVPLSALRSGRVNLADYQILAVPGGFSYGDALGAGRLLGLDLVGWFGDQLRQAHDREMPMIGICNGFQALVRVGLLPGDQSAVLTENERGRFECRWVELTPEPGNDSLWLAELTEPIRCPVAHGEGRFVAADLDAIGARSGVAFRYTAAGASAAGIYPANPNGSAGDVAGVTDPTGRVLGLMPHPENHIFGHQDVLRGRVPGGRSGPLFRAAVNAVRSA